MVAETTQQPARPRRPSVLGETSAPGNLLKHHQPVSALVGSMYRCGITGETGTREREGRRGLVRRLRCACSGTGMDAGAFRAFEPTEAVVPVDVSIRCQSCRQLRCDDGPCPRSTSFRLSEPGRQRWGSRRPAGRRAEGCCEIRHVRRRVSAVSTPALATYTKTYAVQDLSRSTSNKALLNCAWP